jgi:hypothetical protein
MYRLLVPTDSVHLKFVWYNLQVPHRDGGCSCGLIFIDRHYCRNVL